VVLPHEEVDGRVYETRKFAVALADGRVGVGGYVRDITERTRVEDALRHERMLSDAIIDSIPGPFYMLDGDGRYVRWNAYQRDEIVGKPDDRILGTSAVDTIHPDDRALVAARIANVIENGGVEVVEVRVLLRGGPAFRWFLLTGRRIAIDGHPFLVGSGIDTERVRAEEGLREGEAFLTSLLETIPVPVFYKDAEGRYLGFNKAFEAFFGRSKEELIGKNVFDINPPDLASVYHAQDVKLLQKPGVQAYDSQVKGAGGAVRDVVFHKGSMTDSRGVVTGLIGVVLDITARKEAEQALAAAAGQWRETFDAMSDSVALFDRDGRVVRCNAVTSVLSGRPYDDILGRRCFEVFHDVDQFHDDCPQQRALVSGRTETSVVEQDGRWLRLSFQPLFDADGEPAGGVHVVSDVSELKRAERGLRESLSAQEAVTTGVIEALVRSVEARDPFTAGHQRRVSELVAAMARHLDFDEEHVEGLRVAGLLHDVGKIMIPAEILSKPGRLTAMEFELIKATPRPATRSSRRSPSPGRSPR